MAVVRSLPKHRLDVRYALRDGMMTRLTLPIVLQETQLLDTSLPIASMDKQKPMVLSSKISRKIQTNPKLPSSSVMTLKRISISPCQISERLLTHPD